MPRVRTENLKKLNVQQVLINLILVNRQFHLVEHRSYHISQIQEILKNLNCVLASLDDKTMLHRFIMPAAVSVAGGIVLAKSSFVISSNDANDAQKPSERSGVVAMRPSSQEYDLVRGGHMSKHLIHDTLQGDGRLELYELWAKKGPEEGGEEVIAVVRFGDEVNGHPGVVHGGMTAAVIDNTFGWVYLAYKQIPGFTAYLNVNYREPVLANTECILRTRVTKNEGRKKFMEAHLIDAEGQVLVEADALFINPADSWYNRIIKWYYLSHI